MSEKHTNSCVAIFKSHLEAEEAVKHLQKSGFDMKKSRADRCFDAGIQLVSAQNGVKEQANCLAV